MMKVRVEGAPSPYKSEKREPPFTHSPERREENRVVPAHLRGMVNGKKERTCSNMVWK
jgi:hypothetical protein